MRLSRSGMTIDLRAFKQERYEGLRIEERFVISTEQERFRGGRREY